MRNELLYAFCRFAHKHTHTHNVDGNKFRKCNVYSEVDVGCRLFPLCVCLDIDFDMIFMELSVSINCKKENSLVRKGQVKVSVCLVLNL